MPRRYRIRGIPATPDFLDANRDAIPFDAAACSRRNSRCPAWMRSQIAELTHSAVAVMRNRLPNADGTALFDALDAILFRRDKKVAHNEVVSDEEIPAMTWGNTRKLLDHAKTVVAAIGGGYFGISYKSYFTDG